MRARLLLTIVVAVAMVTAACGDSKSSLLPTAPSALSTESPNVDAGTTAAGTMANGPKPGNGNGGGNSPAPVTTETTKVEFEGLIDAVDTTTGSITVSGQLIYVTGDTVIRHGDRYFRFSALHRGDRVHVRANRVGTTVTATEIKLQNPGDVVDPPPPPPDPDQLVSVTAFDADAMEGADTATFRLSRTGTATQLGAPLSVAFALNGTASTADYTLVPATANFLANQATVDVTVMAATDGEPEPPESVILTVSPGTGYQAGSPASATVMINDPPDPDPVVSVMALDPAAIEPSPTVSADSGTFQLTRTGSAAKLANPLTVSFTLGGTATNGSDYATLQLTAAFAPNAATATVTVMPLGDSLTEGSELVELMLASGAGYQLGSPQSAVVTIADPPLPQVSIFVNDADASELDNTGRYTVSRSGNLSSPLIVTLRWGGTATFGSFASGGDYLVSGADNNNVNPTTLTFEAGVNEMSITVEPFRDLTTELQETIELTVVDGDTYDLGTVFTGVVFIAANNR